MSPKGTKMDKMYEAMKSEGMDKGKAARVAQSKTGLALATGLPPKTKKKKAPEAITRFMNRRNKKEGKK
jgi:hypothetical protein